MEKLPSAPNESGPAPDPQDDLIRILVLKITQSSQEKLPHPAQPRIVDVGRGPGPSADSKPHAAWARGGSLRRPLAVQQPSCRPQQDRRRRARDVLAGQRAPDMP